MAKPSARGAQSGQGGSLDLNFSMSFNEQDEITNERRARPVIAWPGGKTRMLKHLLPLIPPHTLYCEVFGGGLALLLAKSQSEVEVINDINGDLVSFYRTCKYHLDPLLDELDLVTNSRQDFQDYLAQPGLTEIQRAARWFIRNKLSFGGMGRLALLRRREVYRAYPLIPLPTCHNPVPARPTRPRHEQRIRIRQIKGSP